MGSPIQNLSVRWWQWPNILALDAVLIAICWQSWLGATGWAEALVLGLSVWLTYTADRWMDVRGLASEHIVTDRHRFACHHQRAILITWVVVLIVDVGLSLLGLTRMQFCSGLVLLGLCIAYSVAVHRHLRVPKEVLVAVIFALGTGLFPALEQPTATLPAILAFFLLAFANCSLIAFRELSIDREMGRTSLARQHPGSRHWAFYALLGAAATGLLLAFFSALPYGLISVCATGMFALGLCAESLSIEVFRVLADTLLLLPVAALLIPVLQLNSHGALASMFMP